jgi:hypothetical protein
MEPVIVEGSAKSINEANIAALVGHRDDGQVYSLPWQH